MIFDNGFMILYLGHIAYIKAYVSALSGYEGYNGFNKIEITVAVILILFAFLAVKKFKMSFSMKLLKYGVMLYVLVLITMFLKATALGVNFLVSGGENGIFALLALMIGSAFFVMSDTTLSVLLFGGQKKNKPLKIFNIVTYFAGQMLLASSILFIS